MPDFGDCFVVAAKLIMNDPTLTLVHGWPLGSKGSAIEGQRYWHAWVEQTQEVVFPQAPDHPVQIEHVIDNSNGKDAIWPTAFYYQAGRIEHTWRYSSEQAARLMMDTGTYGPWVDQDPPGDDGTWRRDPGNTSAEAAD